MHTNLRLTVALLALVLALAAGSARAQSEPGGRIPVYLPAVFGPPAATNRIGLDLRVNAGGAAVAFAAELQPGLVRAGDLLWSQIEPTRGGGYQWEHAAALEANIARLRAVGIEPIVVIQWTPEWAQSIPGQLCSPPRPEHVAALARFAGAAAARYADGPLAVHAWQLWNEPDFNVAQVDPISGSGCWATTSPPFYGGDTYGQVLKQVSPAIKAANPRATVVAAGLAHFWPDDTVTTGFLRGMLAVGAGSSFDALSFHAYGTWQAGDRLIFKANSLRRVLAEYGRSATPLIAAEVGAVCYTNDSCPPDFRRHQASYAARLYPQVIALDLQSAFWFTLAGPNPGFLQSHLIEDAGVRLTPYPAFYALRNSVRLLSGARATSPPPPDPAPNQADAVQSLIFQTPGALLYVLWVHQPDAARNYTLAVLPGARVTCTTRLDLPVPSTADCSDADGDGRVSLVVAAPVYVEVR